MNELIHEKLLEERAKELSVAATDEEVETAVERVKRQYNLATDAEFDAALEDLEHDARRPEAADAQHDHPAEGRRPRHQLASSTSPTTRCASSTSGARSSSTRSPEQAHVAEIVIRFDAERSRRARAAAAARIEEARAKIAAGTPFADVAKEYSEGNARERGGDARQRRTRASSSTALDAAVFSIRRRSTRRRCCSPRSIHLFHVTDRKAAGYRPFAEVKEDLRERIGDDLYEKRYGEYIEKLRREAFVKIYEPALATLRRKRRRRRSRSGNCARPPRAPVPLLLRRGRALARLVRPAAVLLRPGAGRSRRLTSNVASRRARPRKIRLPRPRRKARGRGRRSRCARARARSRAASSRSISTSSGLRRARSPASRDLRARSSARGGRMLRAPTLFEDAVKMLLTTNCSWAATRGMVVAADRARRRGAAARFRPEPSRGFRPRPSRAACAAAIARAALRAVRAARRVGTSSISPPGKTARRSSEEVREAIVAEHGFGPYAAEGLLRILGRHDFFALDSWMRQQYRRLYPGPAERPTARSRGGTRGSARTAASRSGST